MLDIGAEAPVSLAWTLTLEPKAKQNRASKHTLASLQRVTQSPTIRRRLEETHADLADDLTMRSPKGSNDARKARRGRTLRGPLMQHGPLH